MKKEETKKKEQPKKESTAKLNHPTKKQKRRRIIFTVIFVFINIAAIAMTAGAEFGESRSAEDLSKVHLNGWFLIPAVLCFLIAISFEIQKYVLMMREMTKNKDKFDVKHARKVARRTVLLGKYYDNITPAAVGGQPFQIYYIRKNSGLSHGASTSIPVFGMISGQISFLVIILVCMIFGGLKITGPVGFSAICLGIAFYAFWPVVILLATFWPKILQKIVEAIVRLLAKIRIVKNKERTLAKFDTEISEYTKCIKQILKKRGLFFKTVLYSVIFNAFVAFIPFFVLIAFGGGMDFWECFVTTVTVNTMVYFVPTPGNAGAAEGAFFVVFSALSQGYIFWAMLVWRFFSYYVYIIAGAIIYLRMFLEKRKADA